MTTADYRLGYRGDIEGLRAVAVMLVVAAHASVPGLAGGFVGVDVFFVLSGFLITGLLLQEVAGTGGIRFGDFYLRRLRRLFPVLLVMIATTSLAAAFLLASGVQLEQAKAAGAAAFWVSNIHFALMRVDYFSAGAEGNLFLHTWSLGVEEQFYLLWPTLVLWAVGRGRGLEQIARLKRLMVGIAVVSLALCVLFTQYLPQMAFYMMPMRAWQFAIGALIWLYLRKDVPGSAASDLPRWAAVARYWLGWLGLVVVMGVSVAWGGKESYPGWRAMMPTLGAAAIIVAGFRGARDGVASLLAWRPLQMIGRVSYSWYLWHWPVLLIGYALTQSQDPWTRAGEVIFSLGLAILSYWFIESPIRRQGYWLKHQNLTFAGTAAVMLTVGLSTTSWHAGALHRAESDELRRYVEAHLDAPVIYNMGCDDWYHSDKVAICVFGRRDATHTAVLMGDSIAAQWFPAFAEIFKRPDWRLIVLTKSSCPMVDVPYFYERIGREYTECATWRSRALKQLAAVKPDIVVLGSMAIDDFTHEQWVEGTARVLGILSPGVGHIYVMRDTPHLPFDGPNCLSTLQERPAWLGLLLHCSAPGFDERGQRIFGWLQEASGRFANVRIIDMNDLVCPQGRCHAELNGVIVYRDTVHLTASFVQSIAPQIAQRMNLPDINWPPANGVTAAAH